MSLSEYLLPSDEKHWSVFLHRIGFAVSAVLILAATIASLTLLGPYAFEHQSMYTAYVGVTGSAAALTSLLIVVAFAKVKSHNTNIVDAAGAVIYCFMAAFYAVSAGLFYDHVLARNHTAYLWSVITAAMAVALLPLLVARILIMIM